MGKTLIIAEKPSVAGDIVKALPGKFTRSKTHFESNDHIVSYAIGHLVSIAYPEEIDPALQKWSLDNLPILPELFPLTVLPNTRSQFNALVKLIRRRDVEVILNLDPVQVHADPNMIGRVLLNLVVNARDAMGGSGKITISVGGAVQPKDAPAEGRWGVVSVKDTGPGIPDHVLPHLFEPFFTTKDRDRGSGMGLASVQGLVTQAGGHITAQSPPGQGACFNLFLPQV